MASVLGLSLAMAIQQPWIKGLIFELLESVSQKLTQWLFALEPHRLYVKPEMQSREMAQPLKVPSVKPDYQSLMPGTPHSERKGLVKVVLWLPLALWHLCTPTAPQPPTQHTNKNNSLYKLNQTSMSSEFLMMEDTNNPALVQNYV